MLRYFLCKNLRLCRRNQRLQAVFLQAAEQSIDDAINAAKNKSPLELIEIDISSAYENLGFITGDSVREDVIDQVFSRFCLGK